jgi:enoyl-CoA hydratase/carnithine racemase
MLNIRSLALKACAKPSLYMTSQRMFSSATYDNIIVEKQDGGVAQITLNRPKALNALCLALFNDLHAALKELDQDPEIGAIVLTGSQKAFAAGADIKEMSERQYPDTFVNDMLTWWDQISKIKKPIVGAVNGYSLGGGNELAMMCDILLASDTARFGQPEINLGVIPGMGGTQRLTHAIGKSRAMEMILTGDMMKADEAAQRGLVSRVVASDLLVAEALTVARKIASKSRPTVAMAKECVNQAYE